MKSSTIKNNKQKDVPVYNEFYDPDQQNFDIMPFQQVQDQQYNRLLNNNSKKKIKTNSYFQTNPKYKTLTYEPEYQEHLIQQNNFEDEIQNGDNQIKKALVNLKKSKKAKNQLMMDEINRIDQEDQNYFDELQKSNNNLKDCQSLKNQLQLYKKLVRMRYYSQNELQQIKKYPNKNIPKSENLNNLQKDAQIATLHNFNSLLECTQQVANSAFNLELKRQQNLKQIESFGINSEGYKNKKLNVQKIFTDYEEMIKETSQKMEKQLIKWSQKTMLLNNSSNTSSQYSSLIMQTPLGQTQKVMSNWERASSKCQLKRGTFKVLFEKEDNIKLISDKQIYDDHELFIQLEKQFEAQIENKDDEFLYANTMKFLKNRESRPINHNQVDRKASKNRKLRFNTHPKLLNFMSSQPPNLLEARDEIVKNIFNSGQGITQDIDYIDI